MDAADGLCDGCVQQGVRFVGVGDTGGSSKLFHGTLIRGLVGQMQCQEEALRIVANTAE